MSLSSYIGGLVSVNGGGLTAMDVFNPKDDKFKSSQGNKRKLIEKIATFIGQVIGKSAPSSSADQGELIAFMVKHIPNTKKSNGKFSNDKQERLCVGIGNIMNEWFGSKVIDLTAGPNAICDQVSDYSNSLSIGLNKEFVTITNTVRTMLENLKVAKEMLGNSYTAIRDEIVAEGSDTLNMNVDPLHDVHVKITNELERQIALLSNAFNAAVGTKDIELSDLLAESSELKSMVTRIAGTPGTTSWSDKLSYQLLGVANVAQVANVVREALKTIGMSVSDYKNIKSLSELNKKVFDIVSNIPKSKLTAEYIEKSTTAMNLLRQHQGQHKEVSAAIGGAASGGANGGRVGLEKKLSKQNKTTTLLVNDFKRQASSKMKTMYNALAAVSKKIGTAVPMSDDLRIFKALLMDLKLVYIDGVEQALVGINTHPTSIEKKDTYMSIVTALSNKSGELGPQFAAVKASIDDLVKMVDYYSDTLKAKQNVTAASRASVQGASDTSVQGGAEPATATLNQAIRVFDHFYKISKFKQNLITVSSEMKSYKSNYPNMLGRSVAAEIEALGKAHQVEMETLAKDIELTKVLKDGVAADKAGKYGKYTMKTIQELKGVEFDAKKDLYAVAQAVDLSLLAFTDGTIKNIDDVREVGKLLSNVEIISNWFNNKSGDTIASMFEIFPWNQDGEESVFNEKLQKETVDLKKTKTNISATGHYYDSVMDVNGTTELKGAGIQTDTTKLPANPFLPISTERALEAQKFAKYSISKMYALKNIVAAFSYIGDKIGGKSISSEVFMGPSEIHRLLMKYIYVSSLSMGWANGDNHYSDDELPVKSGELMNAYAHDDAKRNKITALANKIRTLPNFTGYDPNLHNEFVDTLQLGYTKNHTSEILSLGAGTLAATNAFIAFNTDLIAIVAGGPTTNMKANYDAIIAATPAFTHKARAEHVLYMHSGSMIAIADNNKQATFAPYNPYKLDKETDLMKCQRQFGVVMSGIPTHRKGDPEADKHKGAYGWNMSFEKEDKVFVNIIKAMVAKIFTVTGLYNMLNFADKDTRIMGPTRLILGGAVNTPKVYPEAMDLYIRLPLLAEFYRDIFTIDAKNDKTKLAISMVPEVGSTWAKFITLIFNQPKDVDGKYSDTVTKEIVHTINEIYQSFKSRASGTGSVAMTVISDFIAEINSRYGLMTRGEQDVYEKRKTDRLAKTTSARYDDLEDFDILNEDSARKSAAPSDQYGSYVPVSLSAASDVYNLNADQFEALHEFRGRIEKVVNTSTPNDSTGFETIIASSKQLVNNTSDVEERFKLVMQMMSGIGYRSKNKSEAKMMFHEAVVVPLNILSDITNTLQRYTTEVVNSDAARLFKLMKSHPRGTDSCDAYVAKLNDEVKDSDALETATIASRLLRHDTETIPGHDVRYRDIPQYLPASKGDVEKLSKIFTKFVDHPSVSNTMELNAAGVGAYGTDAKINNAITDFDVKYKALEQKEHTNPGNVTISPAEITSLISILNNINDDITLNSTPRLLAIKAMMESRILATERRQSRLNTVNVGVAGTIIVDNILGIAHPYITGTIVAASYDTKINDALGTGVGVGAKANIITLRKFLEIVGVAYPKEVDRMRDYMSIRWEYLYKHMTDLVYGLTSNMGNLCSVSMSGGQMVISTEKLMEMCEKALADVNTNLTKFRGVIDTAVLNKYTDRSIVGSSNWLHSNLIEKMFRTTNKSSLRSTNNIVTNNFLMLGGINPDTSKPLASCSPMGYMSLMFSELLAYHNTQIVAPIDAAAFAGLTTGWKLPAGTSGGMSIESTLSELTHYNTRTMTSTTASGSGSKSSNSDYIAFANFASSTSLALVDGNADVLSHLLKSKGGTPSADRKFNHNIFQNRIDFYLQNGPDGNTDSGFRGDNTGSRTLHTVDGKYVYAHTSKVDYGAGLMMKFNEVMHSYIAQFWDVSESKIYSKLLDTPANGPLTAAVHKSLGWNDFGTHVNEHLVGMINTAFESKTDYGTSLGTVGVLTLKILPYYAAHKSLMYLYTDFLTQIDINVEIKTDVLTVFNSCIEKQKSKYPRLNIGYDELFNNIAKFIPTVLNDADAKDELSSLSSSSSHIQTIIICTFLLKVIGASKFTTYDNEVKLITNMNAGGTNITYNGNNKYILQILPELKPLTDNKHKQQIVEIADYMEMFDNGHVSYVPYIVDNPVELATLINLLPGYEIPHKIGGGIAATMGDPTEILFASLSKIIRTALSEVGTGNVKTNVITSMSEIPLRMKENMKANLPIFKELFQLITTKTNIVQGTLKLPGISTERTSATGKGGRTQFNGVSGIIHDHKAKSEKESSIFYNGLLDKIKRASTSMIATIDSVISELNDSATYFELHENSIATYKNANNKLPFMPTSHMSLLLQPVHDVNKNQRDPNLMYPIAGSGDQVFDFNYGTRWILHNYDEKPNIDRFPSMIEALERYNNTASKSSGIDTKSFEHMNTRNVHLLRWIGSNRIYSTLFGAPRSVYDTTSSDVAVAPDTRIPAPYQVAKQTVLSVISMIQSTNIEQVIEEFMEYIAASSASTVLSRSNSRIVNIQELNINPININALMREIPFSNLYNYAYTYDSHINKIFDSNETDVTKLLPATGAGNNVSIRDTLALLCKYPHATINAELYKTALTEIVIGNTAVDNHQRPAFISDQLWNKALLGITNPEDVKKYDPKVGSSVTAAVVNAYYDNPANNGLTYIKPDHTIAVTPNPNLPNSTLRSFGIMRFNTTLMRNLMFITNAHRIMRMKIDNELTAVRGAIASGPEIANPRITTYTERETVVDLEID